jgi:hypothetical protein
MSSSYRPPRTSEGWETPAKEASAPEPRVNDHAVEGFGPLFSFTGVSP